LLLDFIFFERVLKFKKKDSLFLSFFILSFSPTSLQSRSLPLEQGRETATLSD